MKTIGFIFGVLITVFLTALLAAVPFYVLWNWLMPEIFALKTLTFWQSFGLLLLSNILFKSTTTSK